MICAFLIHVSLHLAIIKVKNIISTFENKAGSEKNKAFSKSCKYRFFRKLKPLANEDLKAVVENDSKVPIKELTKFNLLRGIISKYLNMTDEKMIQ